jgi:hypothetical protein
MKRKAKKKNPSRPPSYQEAHWGITPQDIHTAKVNEPRDNSKLIGLGSVVSIVYCTEKGGDGEPIEYEHHFSKKEPPLLAYGDRDGKLYFVGGEYEMTKHGIER